MPTAGSGQKTNRVTTWRMEYNLDSLPPYKGPHKGPPPQEALCHHPNVCSSDTLSYYLGVVKGVCQNSS
jgi:hypothetical protein